MRTKTLIAAAAILAVSLATTVAQTNVYSQNVVGYINVNLLPGYNLVGNPLDLDGTGTNNTVLNHIGTNVPLNTYLHVWSATGFKSASYGTKGWSGVTADHNAAMNPGGGFFIQVPTATTITFVGNVLQGNLQNPYPQGYSIRSSIVPQAGGLQTVLGFSPVPNDYVYRFNPTNQSYVVHSYTAKGWSGGEPNLKVAEAFFLNAATGGTWTRNFTVQ